MTVLRWRLRAATVLCVWLGVWLAGCEDEHAPYYIEAPDPEPDAGDPDAGELDGAAALDASLELDGSRVGGDASSVTRDAGARDARADAAGSSEAGAHDAQQASDAQPHADAQHTPADAGSPAPDGGMPPPPDGGMPPPHDGGHPPPPDGGMPPPPDGGAGLDGGQPGLDAGPADAGALTDATYDAGLGDASPVDGGACTLTANTYATAIANDAGCRVLLRDATDCAASRIAQGLSGFWLKFSCRVLLTATTNAGSQVVMADSNNLPDYKSNYFTSNHVCYEVYTGAIRNPNNIAEMALKLYFPRSPTTSSAPFSGAIVGLALNGVGIFGNFAAPTDDIYTEAQTFDRCGAHPQMHGMYHYHSEPYSISFDDANFIGVLRDGYPVYGRKDVDGSYPSNLDGYGGHTSATPDSATPVYHYHLNEQTQTDASKSTYGQKQWFLTKGAYRGTPGSCTGCN